MSESKEIARLEIVFYEDRVDFMGEGDENAVIAGLAALIEDNNEENKFNYLMKAAISFLITEAEQKAEQDEQAQPDA